MSDPLWGYGTDVASDQATIAAAKRWQSRLFTTSGTWTVPADVGCIWVDGCGAGCGGGGGYAGVGGGGSGGSAASGVVYGRFPTTPGEVLSLTIGAGGTGSLPGQTENYSAGNTVLTGTQEAWTLRAGYTSNSRPGTVSAGGAVTVSSPYSAGTLLGMTGVSGNANGLMSGIGMPYQATIPGAGGAPGVAGNFSGIVPFSPNHPVNNASYVYGGATSASGGGGGAGGCGTFGIGGRGGAGGVAGENATGYGAGGGAGGSNASGGNGSPGFIRVYVFSATTI